MAKRTPKSQKPRLVGLRVTQSPIRLEKAEAPQEFQKRIKHLAQGDIRNISLSTLFRLLITKGVLTQLEVQQAFLDDMELGGL
jgi:hypothetical protein